MDSSILVVRIRERMQALEITSARQLAVLAGVDNVSVSKLLADNRPQVSAATVARLSTALHCSVDYLLGLVDDPAGTGFVIPEGGEELLRLLDTMPLSKRVELLDVAAVMADSEAQRRARRFEEYEQLEAQLRAHTTPAEYRTAMSQLFRAARANDRAALAALAARYGLMPEEANQQPEDV